MLGVVLVFCLVIISAELTAAQYVDSEGRERKTLNRNKDVVYDKEKELSSRTTMEIDMYVRDEKPVDVFLMTKDNYELYKNGQEFDVEAEGTATDVTSYKSKFKLPHKAHWVWVVDNTNRPSGGANSGEDLVIYAKVEITTLNILAYFALLAFIILIIIILLSSIYNRVSSTATAHSGDPGYQGEDDEEGYDDTGHYEADDSRNKHVPRVVVPPPRRQRTAELPGFEGETQYEEHEYIEEGPDGSSSTRTVHKHGTAPSPVSTVPSSHRPAIKIVPGYIQRREARGEGLGSTGMAAPDLGRQRVTEPGMKTSRGQEFGHCPSCFAIVPSTAPYCYRCKASLTGL